MEFHVSLREGSSCARSSGSHSEVNAARVRNLACTIIRPNPKSPFHQGEIHYAGDRWWTSSLGNFWYFFVEGISWRPSSNNNFLGFRLKAIKSCATPAGSPPTCTREGNGSTTTTEQEFTTCFEHEPMRMSICAGSPSSHMMPFPFLKTP